MLNENTIMKLHEMKLRGMARAMDDQLQNSDFQQLQFEERFGLIVDAEYYRRQNNRMSKLIKDARYPDPNACIEDINYREDRELDRNLITRLSAGTYVQEGRNVVILGSAGAGKTFLATALGMSSNRARFTVLYTKLHDVLGELAVVHGDKDYRKVLAKCVKVKLLILDEWLLFPLTVLEARILFDLIDARYRVGSTIICSQFDTGGWHDRIGEPALADAICDRIVNNSYKIVIGGKDSMRRLSAIEPGA